jgi:hypothetical protein
VQTGDTPGSPSKRVVDDRRRWKVLPPRAVAGTKITRAGVMDARGQSLIIRPSERTAPTPSHPRPRAALILFEFCKPLSNESLRINHPCRTGASSIYPTALEAQSYSSWFVARLSSLPVQQGYSVCNSFASTDSIMWFKAILPDIYSLRMIFLQAALLILPYEWREKESRADGCDALALANQ